MIDPGECVRDEPLDAAQHRRVLTTAWAMGGVSGHLRQWQVLREVVREEWVPADQSREWLLRGRYTGRRRWLRGSARSAIAPGFGESFVDEPAWERRAPYGDYWATDEGRRPEPRQGCWQLPTPEFFAALPRSPELLLKRLRDDSPVHPITIRRRILRSPRYDGPWTYATDALSSGFVPADLRAALYRTLQRKTDVRVMENVAASAGTCAIALVLDLTPVRHELFIDPADGSYLGKRETVTAWNPTFQVRPGTVIGEEVLVTSVVDDGIPSRAA